MPRQMVGQDDPDVACAPNHHAVIASRPVFFIVGAGRSGTTWLQTLLSQDPAIATAPETKLFGGYLHLLQRRWHRETSWRSLYGDKTGIQKLVSEVEFEALMQHFAHAVLQRILETKPEAKYVLEKTPSHVHHAALISRVLPNSYFIHIIRDPRSVCKSLVEAGRGWGEYWAPEGPIDAAKEWRRSVEKGWEIDEMSGRYLEVRYEDLLTDPVVSLQRVLAWMGITVSDEHCATYVSNCSAAQLRRNDSAVSALLPTGQTGAFVRDKPAVDWAETLPRSWIRSIEWVAGEALVRAGYEPMLAPKRKPLRVWAKEQLERIEWRISATISGLARRL